MINNIPLPLSRNIFFGHQVSQSTIEPVTAKILEINENDEYLKKLYAIHGISYTPNPIKIFIDSYGGAVYQILGLISIIESSKVPVHTICSGTAMSCGFILLISGHKRFCYENSTMLYHQVSSSSSGTAKEMEESLVEIKRLQKLLEDITLKSTKVKVPQLSKVYETKKDWVISPTEAKKLGIVDEIIKSYSH